jgi:hypothetical protein
MKFMDEFKDLNKAEVFGSTSMYCSTWELARPMIRLDICTSRVREAGLAGSLSTALYSPTSGHAARKGKTI